MRVPPSFFEGVLQLQGLADGRAVATLSVVGFGSNNSTLLSEGEHRMYRHTVGCFMWSMSERPDIAYAAKELARHVTHPAQCHLVGLKRLCRYVRGTVNLF